MAQSMSRASMAIAMIAIGLVSLIYGNDSYVWILIPDMPGSATLVYLCGLVAIASGIGLLWRPYLVLACRALTIFLLLWLVVLKLPWLLASPLQVVRWESFGETLAILAGALSLLANHPGDWVKRHLP